MTGHAFQALPTSADAVAMLRNVRRHVHSGACFMFETRNPLVQAWRRWTGTRTTVDTEPYGHVQEDYTVQRDAGSGIVALTQLRAGPASFRSLQSRCGQLSPSVLHTRLAELRGAGLIETTESGYELSEAGLELGQLLLELDHWAGSWAHKQRDA